MDEGDDRPRRRTAAHQIGEALDDLSLDEIEARILLLRSEIARLEAAGARKRGAQTAANSIFGPA